MPGCEIVGSRASAHNTCAGARYERTTYVRLQTHPDSVPRGHRGSKKKSDHGQLGTGQASSPRMLFRVTDTAPRPMVYSRRQPSGELVELFRSSADLVIMDREAAGSGGCSSTFHVRLGAGVTVSIDAPGQTRQACSEPASSNSMGPSAIICSALAGVCKATQTTGTAGPPLPQPAEIKPLSRSTSASRQPATTWTAGSFTSTSRTATAACSSLPELVAAMCTM